MHDLTKTLALVQRAKAGDRDALDRLFGRYYERVRRSVRVRLGPELRQHLDSGDILQQAFCKGFEIFDSFEMRDEGSLLHWLAKIAERQIRDAADYFSSLKRVPPGYLQSLDDGAGSSGDLVPQPVGREPPPPEKVRDREEIDVIEVCLDELPPHHREIIVLRDFEQLAWEDVARLSGRPSISAAREMHATALLELTRALARRGFTSPDP